MLSTAKSMILFNKVDSIAEVISRIEAITVTDVQEVANEIFNPSLLSSLIFTNGRK